LSGYQGEHRIQDFWQELANRKLEMMAETAVKEELRDAEEVGTAAGIAPAAGISAESPFQSLVDRVCGEEATATRLLQVGLVYR
jgi:hypothetical protein